MTDRELLELAAKAAGYNVDFECESNGWFANGYCEDGGVIDWWNPLTDDGNALRLAVKLNLYIRPQEKCCYVESNPESLLGFSSVGDLQMNNGDPYAATRRAIVRTAAEIGKEMK